MKLTMMQKRRFKRKLMQRLKEMVAGVICGGVLAGLLIAGFVFVPYEPPSAPEHFGQIEYGGVWWDKDDYEQMMMEREEYLKAEQAEEEALIESIRQAQERYEPGIEQEIYEVRTQQTIIGSMDWDADESYILAKIAMAEAEGEDTEGKALVILVVLNRVWSDDFPDTIKEVITEEGQFTAYENGRYDRVEPSEDCYAALEMVQVEHWDESQGATYFERTSTGDTWHSRNLKELFTHGNHTFYKEDD